MLRGLILLALALFPCFAGRQAAAQEAIGAVSRIQGTANGTRGTAAQALGSNTSVFPNEILSTGDGTRLEITFKDNTRLTLSEKAKVTLDTYIFNPAAGLGTIKFEAAGAFAGKIRFAGPDRHDAGGAVDVGVKAVAQAAGEMQFRDRRNFSRPIQQRRVARPADHHTTKQVGFRPAEFVEPRRGEKNNAKNLPIGPEFYQRAAAVLHRAGVHQLSRRLAARPAH